MARAVPLRVPARPRADVQAFPLDDDLVLFDARYGSLFALNTTASLVWSVLSAGFDVAAAADRLSKVAAVGRKQIERDIGLLVEQWAAAHLLEHNSRVRRVPTRRTARRRLARRPLRREGVTYRYVRLMGQGVRVVCEDADSAQACDAVFGGNTVLQAEASHEWPALSVVKRGPLWTLLFDGQRLAECKSTAELVPMIYGNTARILYELSDCFAAVHAAAVAKGSACVLLPAVSASGKSTLTAALVASGYRYCTDDLALLTAPPIRLRPVPMQIGVKEGAWSVLTPFWPKLDTAKTHRRADGQLVRYLPPVSDASAHPSADALAVRAVVYPKFSRGAAGRLRRIPRAEGLTRMAEAGYDLADKLDHHAVEALIAWFGTLECYELEFDSLDTAVKSFGEALT